MVADYIDEFIMFCAGLWMAGIGFGFLADRSKLAPASKHGGPTLEPILNGWGRC